VTRIAISYRRDDSAAIAGRIFDRLVARYGTDAVFRDVDGNIPLGIDFREHINSILSQTDITLVVVGKRWFGPLPRRRRRIDDPADPVRVEVETALRNGMPVVPVLVEGGAMPKADQLPDSLKEFVYRNGLEVDSGRDFDQHIERLIRSLERILAWRPETRLQIDKERPIRGEAPRDETISVTTFSIERLSGTMSNPKFENDLSRLHNNKYMSASIIGKETIIIVIGNRIPAELLDRPIAECLRDRIDERGEGDRFRRSIVLTDAAWFAEAENLADNPVIAIGGPPANELSRVLSESVQGAPGEGIYTIRRTGEVQGFFRRNSAGLPQVGLWGKTAKGTRLAVEHYSGAINGLDEFLKMSWISPYASSRRRR
jgi:hypothetical protein